MLRTTQGLTLIELVIYLGIMVLLTTGVVNALYGLLTTYQKIKVVKSVERSGILAMDRMTREIRNGSAINAITANTLTVDSPVGSGTRTVLFSLGTTSDIRVSENGVDRGPLTSSSASTTQLVFTQITTAHSLAVKIEFTMRASSTRYVHRATFYDTVILRGSY